MTVRALILLYYFKLEKSKRKVKKLLTNEKKCAILRTVNKTTGPENATGVANRQS